MSNWKSRLNGDATEWLLEESNPFVRYFALRWLLEKPASDPKVAKAREAIDQSAPIQKIIARQRAEGYWGSDPRPHQGTRGPLALCLWLGAPSNAAIEKAMHYRLKGCIAKNGGYGITLNRTTRFLPWKAQKIFLPCHGAELLQLMLRYGFAEDPRARKLFDWLVSIQQSDGAIPCISRVRPFPCLWATADVLRAMRDVPSAWLTPPAIAARDRAVELFLNSNLCQYRKAKPSPEWFRFGYPLQWTSDILDVLELIAPYVTPDDGQIQEGLALVLRKQDKQGRWRCEKQPKGGKWIEQYVPLEKIGQPSKWVTLHALKMIKTLYADK